MDRVLIVDDVAAMAEQYAYDLERMGGYETRTALGGKEALDALQEEPADCVILDLEMPGTDGFAVLRTLRERGDTVPVIVYTGTGNYDRCVQAVRLGAYGFIDKTEPMERVIQAIEQALRQRRLEREVESLRGGRGEETPLVGGSGAMVALREAIARVAPVPAPALILGESGSGKELVARELHRLGPAPREPFVAVNSAALPDALVESELFGHERGAFTGAVAARKGAFEAAGSGTLFLDEIGDLPPAAQAKLLRVLEQREVMRLGGQRAIPIQARVVAATHRDLERDVDDGRFRQDLLFRLNVHVLRVPPLRERLSDIPDLVHHLVASICARYGLQPREVTPGCIDVLMTYDWRRNNVRELRNIVERMVITAPEHRITAADVPPDLGGTRERREKGESPRTFRERRAEAERAIVRAELERNDWHITRTAEALDLADHASLLKIMRRLGIERRS